MLNDRHAVWLATGLRTPFVGVDGPFVNSDSLALSVPVVQAMASQVHGSIDFAVWGSVVLKRSYKIDLIAPTKNCTRKIDDQ